MLDTSHDHRAVAEDLSAPRYGRAVAVGVGVVVAEVNLRSQLVERLDQGDEPLGRGVVDDDHPTAGDRRSHVDLGGEGRTLLRPERLRQDDILELYHLPSPTPEPRGAGAQCAIFWKSRDPRMEGELLTEAVHFSFESHEAVLHAFSLSPHQRNVAKVNKEDKA